MDYNRTSITLATVKQQHLTVKVEKTNFYNWNSKIVVVNYQH